jgi:putative transposase
MSAAYNFTTKQQYDLARRSRRSGRDLLPEARQEVFDYIEMFYNPTRKHTRNGMLSPVEFERQRELRTESV